jgi:hypothetical protein
MPGDPRCVRCGQAKSRHSLDTLKCPRHHTFFASMELPAGVTCNDCLFMHFCRSFLMRQGSETSCDWFPIKFYPKVADAE